MNDTARHLTLRATTELDRPLVIVELPTSVFVGDDDTQHCDLLLELALAFSHLPAFCDGASARGGSIPTGANRSAPVPSGPASAVRASEPPRRATGPRMLRVPAAGPCG